MEKFISCDWGTSAFRLRLIETATQTVLAKVETPQGIAAVNTLWKDSAVDKFAFYSSILLANTKTLEQQYGFSLDDLTIVISGMASSSIGMIELDYKELPFKINSIDLLIHIAEQSGYFKHRLIIISGVKTATDVIRGEETILIGCDVSENNEEQLFVFPGTHSKHIIVQNGIVTDFKTYMTGEFFDLLSTKSILSSSVKKSDSVTQDEINMHFENGVIEGSTSNLLNTAFHVRTNQLFNKLRPIQNYHYLSGLLIGTEVKELQNKNYIHVTLVSSKKLNRLYLQALQILCIREVKQIDADEALIKGQCIIYKQYH